MARTVDMIAAADLTRKILAQDLIRMRFRIGKGLLNQFFRILGLQFIASDKIQQVVSDIIQDYQHQYQLYQPKTLELF